MKSKYIAGSIVAAAVIFFLVKKIDLRSSLALLKGLDVKFLILCAALYVIAHVFRALRVSLLLEGTGLGFASIFAVVCIQFMLNLVLPAKSGEGSYPYLLKKYGRLSYSKGIASLVLARGYDLLTVVYLVTVFAGYVVFGHRLPAAVLFAGYMLFTALIIFLLRKMDGVLVFTAKLLGKMAGLAGSGSGISGKLSTACSKLADEFGQFSTGPRLFRLAAYSLAIWLLTYTMFYLFVNSLDPGVSFIYAVLGSSGVILVGAAPINAPGSVGTLEAGWTLGLVIAGINKEAALASGIMMHAFVICFGLFLSFVGIMMLNRHALSAALRGRKN